MRPEILLAVIAAARVYDEAGHDFTITACVEGKHTTGSLQYAGAAIDVRTRDLASAAATAIWAAKYNARGSLAATFCQSRTALPRELSPPRLPQR